MGIRNDVIRSEMMDSNPTTSTYKDYECCIKSANRTQSDKNTITFDAVNEDGKQFTQDLSLRITIPKSEKLRFDQILWIQLPTPTVMGSDYSILLKVIDLRYDYCKMNKKLVHFAQRLAPLSPLENC